MEFEELVKGIGIAKATIICWPDVPDKKMSLENLSEIFQMVQNDSSKVDLKNLSINRILRGRRKCDFWYDLSLHTRRTEDNKSIQKRIVRKMVRSAISFHDLFISLEAIGYHRDDCEKEFNDVVSRAVNFGEFSFDDWSKLFYRILDKEYAAERTVIKGKMINTAKTSEDWLNVYRLFVDNESNYFHELIKNKLSALAGKDIPAWLKIYKELTQYDNAGEEDKRLAEFVFDKVVELAGDDFKVWLSIRQRTLEETELEKMSRKKLIELASTAEDILLLHRENCYGRGGHLEYWDKIPKVITSFEEGLKLCQEIKATDSLLKRMLEFADTDEKLLELYRLSSGEIQEIVCAKIRERVKI